MRKRVHNFSSDEICFQYNTHHIVSQNDAHMHINSVKICVYFVGCCSSSVLVSIPLVKRMAAVYISESPDESKELKECDFKGSSSFETDNFIIESEEWSLNPAFDYVNIYPMVTKVDTTFVKEFHDAVERVFLHQKKLKRRFVMRYEIQNVSITLSDIPVLRELIRVFEEHKSITKEYLLGSIFNTSENTYGPFKFVLSTVQTFYTNQNPIHISFDLKSSAVSNTLIFQHHFADELLKA